MKTLLWLRHFLGIWLCLTSLRANAQVTLVVEAPAHTPTTDTLFLTGSLNNWNPRSPAHALQKHTDGTYWLTLPALPQPLEFKITRGSWATGETLASGEGRQNRILSPKSAPDTVPIRVENWQDQFPSPAKQHTATANVLLLSEQFYMPQLGKKRRVWLYLPPNYKTSDKRYPVLYMHDGQNLFDAFYSYSGEWGVDETLNQLAKEGGPEVIVVGVDNGGEARMDEYNPWRNQQYGGGKGDDYLDFLVYTLKPYIDANYRTKPDRKNTALAGSSMGGLISLYAVAKQPKVFGKAGVFSPAFWVSPEIYGFMEQAKLPSSTQLYLLAGAKEGEQMVPDMAKMKDLLLQKGVKPKNMVYEVHEDGEHREWFWQREFPKLVKWLFRE